MMNLPGSWLLLHSALSSVSAQRLPFQFGEADPLVLQGCCRRENLHLHTRFPLITSAGVVFYLALTVDAERGVRKRVQPVHRNTFLAMFAAPLTQAIRSLLQALQGLLD